MTRRAVFVSALMAAVTIPLAAQSFSFSTGDASLDITLSSINVQAKADISSYTADLSVSFGVAQPQIQTMMTQEKLEPAEVYLVLQIGQIVDKPPATVITAYRQNKGKGWGAIARALGIKPGSAEFKALKNLSSDRDKKLKDRKKH